MADAHARTYLAVHRIARACVACRRKKTRCTGDRPACIQCYRSGQECIYAQHGHESENNSKGQPQQAPAEPVGEVLERLTVLESAMENVAAQLQRLTDSLESSMQVNNGSSPADEPQQKRRCIGLDQSTRSNERLTRLASPADNGILPIDALTVVVDAYFVNLHNQPYSLFHEGTFRERLTQRTLPDHLLLAVMASAVCFSNHPVLPPDLLEASISYANRSWKSIVSNYFTASKRADIFIVQSIALLALFDFTAGRARHGSAWVKIGMAVRIAQDLGLMLEPPSHLTFAEQEEHRRVFWSIYLLDRLVSCGRGRPPAIVDACCQLQLPCEEQFWKASTWQPTLTLEQLAIPPLKASQHAGEGGAFAHVIVMGRTVGRAAQYMLQDLNIHSQYPPWDSTSDFAAIESDLLHLETRLSLSQCIESTLAPHISPTDIHYQSAAPHIFSRALFHLCYCTLTHPFLLRRRLEIGQLSAPRSFLARTTDTAWLHAARMIQLFRDASAHGCATRSHFSAYCVMVAGSIAALHIHAEDANRRSSASNMLDEAIGFLQTTARHWRNVETMVHMLQALAQNALTYSNLASLDSQVPHLSPEHANFMWSLVDYSTISNEAILAPSSSTGAAPVTVVPMSSAVTTHDLRFGQQDEDVFLSSNNTDLWFDSWVDLFAGSDSVSAAGAAELGRQGPWQA